MATKPHLTLVRPQGREPLTAEELEHLHPIEQARRLLIEAACEEPEPLASALDRQARSLPRRKSVA